MHTRTILAVAAAFAALMFGAPAEARGPRGVPAGEPTDPARPLGRSAVAARGGPHGPGAEARAGGGDRKEKVRDRARKIRGRLLREEVGLDEKRAREVEAVLDRYAEQRKKLLQEQRAARQHLKELLDADGDDQKAFAEALGRIRASVRALQALRDREVDELATLLTPKQQARLLRGLVRLQRRAREHGGGPPGQD